MGAHYAQMGAHHTQMDICKIPIFTQYLHFSQLSTTSTLSSMETFMYNRLWPWWQIKSSTQRCCSWSLSQGMRGDEAPSQLEVPDTNLVLEAAIIKGQGETY